MKTKPINILLVEDNPGDIRLAREALKEGNIDGTLHVVRDGLEAFQFLRRENKFQDAAKPDLVLLDLHMPGKNGFDTLSDIKKEPALHRIPVIVLTTSKERDDILRAYDLHANCFITKPIDMGQFIDIVKEIINFWVLKVDQ